MKYPLFLTRPAMVSSLGEGIETHLDVLLNGGESPLHLSDMPFKLFDLAVIISCYGIPWHRLNHKFRKL